MPFHSEIIFKYLKSNRLGVWDLNQCSRGTRARN